MIVTMRSHKKNKINKMHSSTSDDSLTRAPSNLTPGICRSGGCVLHNHHGEVAPVHRGARTPRFGTPSPTPHSGRRRRASQRVPATMGECEWTDTHTHKRHTLGWMFSCTSFTWVTLRYRLIAMSGVTDFMYVRCLLLVYSAHKEEGCTNPPHPAWHTLPLGSIPVLRVCIHVLCHV